MAQKASLFANGLWQPLSERPQDQKEVPHRSLLEPIQKLHLAGIINPQRMCFTCRFHSATAAGSYCSLMNKPL